MKVKNVSKKVAAIVAIIAVVLSMPIVNLAHGGRTDSNGGHKDNKNASGLGPYHYHCGGHPAHLHDGGVCPYSAPAPAPAAASTPSTPKATSTTTSTSTKSTTPSKVNATKVEIDVEDLQLTIGEKKKLTATIYPSNATDKTVEWSSENTEIATVENGTITAIAAGETKVICTSKDGVKSEVNVVVEEEEVVESENTIEVSAPADETSGGDSSTTTTSDDDTLLGAATLGAMIGVPVYLHKKKKK